MATVLENQTGVPRAVSLVTVLTLGVATFVRTRFLRTPKICPKNKRFDVRRTKKTLPKSAFILEQPWSYN
jgi:hypothetical protein